MSDAAPTPDAILQLGLGFWGSKTLLSAVELGLFTLLAEGPLSAEQLRDRLGLHPRSARDFFDALVALGMLERVDGPDGGVYRNTAATELFLDRRKPSYVGGILEMVNARLFAFWGSLTAALRSGQPQNEIRGGEDIFAALYGDPARLESFLTAMTGISLGCANAIAQRFPWQRYRSFTDVGCAQGGLPVVVAKAQPHLQGIGFDLPPVQPIFERYVREHGVADRMRFQGGDFWHDPLPRTDVLVMGHVLHDWSVEERLRLLRKAQEALPEGGALVVFDAVIDDERRRNAFGLLMSLNMLIETPAGSDYTGAECIAWLREAGFQEAYVEPLAGPDSMVVGIK